MSLPMSCKEGQPSKNNSSEPSRKRRKLSSSMTPAMMTLRFKVEQMKLFHNKLAVLDSICLTGSPNRISPGDRCLVHVQGPNVRQLCETILSVGKDHNGNDNNNTTTTTFNLARWVSTTTTEEMPFAVISIPIDASQKNTTLERNRRGDRLIQCNHEDIFVGCSDDNDIHEDDTDDDDAADISHVDIQDKSQRHFIFASWLVETYGKEFLASGSGVLDVAGGNGQLSGALLQLGIPSAVLDPNPRISSHCGQDGNTNRESAKDDSNQQNAASFEIQVLPFALYTDGQDLTCRTDKVGETVRNCSMIVGMHPDQATEAIVDTAQRLQKPFATVPCCVMPTLFPNRLQRSSGDPVRSHSAFCQYLLDKAPASPNGVGDKNSQFQMITLPFVGRNKVIYSEKSNDN